MAEEKQETKIILERSYTIPLRREFLKAPTHKRTNRAVRAVKQFLQKHMKADSIKLGKNLNLKLWENGIRNPPHKVKINAIKDSEGIVRAELTGKEILLKDKEIKKEEAGVAEKLGLKQEDKEIPAETYKPKSDDEKQESQEKEEKVKYEQDEEKEEVTEEGEKSLVSEQKTQGKNKENQDKDVQDDKEDKGKASEKKEEKTEKKSK